MLYHCIVSIFSIDIKIDFVKILFIYFLGCGEREEDKHLCVRDILISCLVHTPNRGTGLQPRLVP